VIRRRLALLALALAAVFAGPISGAQADGKPNNDCPRSANCALAFNETDNSSLFDFAWSVRHVLGDVVDQGNAAVAYASCNSCQTTAIAIEIVLVEGDPSEIRPENVAAAVNANCNLCDTFAAAYQFVIMTGGPVRFTREGLRTLHEIRKEIRRWGKQHLSNDEMRARLPELIAQLKHVLATELVRVGRDEHGDDETETGRDTDNQPHAPPTTTAATTTDTVETTVAPTTTTTDTATTTETTPTTTAATTTTTP
jgi:putative peptide zinc metalloprotease protein